MSAILGSDFIISFNADGVISPVCYAQDCQINRTFDTREISGPQGRERDYIADYNGYTIQIPILVVYRSKFNYLDFMNAADAGLKLSWSASAYKNGGVIHSGQVLVTEIDLTSQFRDVIKADVSLIGCGKFVTTISPINKVVYLSDFDKNILPGCPNAYPISVFWYDGSLIGPANNPDEVINIFNNYSASHGNYYTLVGSVDGGCYFNMQIDFSAPEPYPDTIFSRQGALFAISTNQSANNVLSTDQDSNNVLTPIG